MSNELKYTATIDPDALVSELIESWVNGNCNEVIEQLATDHPALAALMIVQGAQDRTLTISDCNTIANRLSDRRLELARQLWGDCPKHLESCDEDGYCNYCGQQDGGVY